MIIFNRIHPTWGGRRKRMTELNIIGMTCDHCQHAVKGALESVEGVEGATVDLATGTAKVEGSANVDTLIAAVEEEGYQATPANR
jgi:copper chaperone